MRYHKGKDGWGRDSYEIPTYAVVGASDCGMWSDSPAPSDRVEAELKQFQRALGKATGIKSRCNRHTHSGNVFMVKRWVTVRGCDFERASEFAIEWLRDHDCTTRFIHDADLKQPELGPEEKAS